VRRLALVAAPLLAGATAAGFALHRIARTPFTPYGDFGAAHLEHEVRLAAVLAWREETGSFADKLLAVDGQYPPLLHVLTMPLSFGGYEVADVAWTGLLWLALLAAAVAGCARAITGSGVAASAAATLVFLWPVGPAVATRYYYDLPLTAVLWTAAALALAGWDGASGLDERLRGVRRALAQFAVALPAAAAVGVVAAGACGFKWTALAFAPILVGAAFLTPVHRDRRRWRLPIRVFSLLVATGVGAWLVWEVASTLGRESSLATTFNDMWPGVGTSLYADDGSFVPRAATAAFAGGGDDGGWRPGFLFYPLTLVSAVLSPLFAAALAGPLLQWLRADRRGAPFVAVVVLGQGLFLALFISALDERFLLTLVPGVLLAAAMGWTSLEPRGRHRWGAAVTAAALLVSADVHYGDDGPWAAPVEVPIPGADSVTVRGVSLADSWEQRGWARLDSQPPARMQARRMIWALMHRCGFGPAALQDAPASSTPLGERHWLEYRSMLRTLGAAPKDPPIDDCDAWLGPLSTLDAGDVVALPLLQRAAVEVLDGDDATHAVYLRGCVDEAFPGRAPGPATSLRASELLALERDAPRCLRVFE